MWFPEVYKSNKRDFYLLYEDYKPEGEYDGNQMMDLSDQLRWWWDYFLNRRIETTGVTADNPYGTWSQQTGYVYFPKAFP